MPQWDSKKFEEGATKIAREFNSNGGDLHALTVKTAKEQGLNQEQIRRLGRAVNVKAFEQKFASLKGAKDRIVDFDPVDPESVISSLFSSSEASEKRAAAVYPDLVDQMKSERGWSPAYEKTASVDVLGELFGAVPKDPPIESQINHWRKVAEELRVKQAGAEIQWDGAMEELLGHSKRIYWKRDDFEKDAMALFGGDVLFELNALRTSSKLDPLPATYETAEKLASHLFGEETEDTRLIKKAADARQNYMKASKALEIAKTKVAALVAQVLK
jgi:hypothetical protein